MTKKIIQKTGMQLSKPENVIVTAHLDNVARSNFKKLTAEFRRKAIARRKFRSPLMAALRKAKIDLKQPPAPQHGSLKNRLIKNVEARRRQQAKKKPSSPNMVFGNAFGVTTPPYDFQWRPEYFFYPPSAASLYAAEFAAYPPALVNAQSGWMDVWGSAGWQMEGMQSSAGLGFWYVPDRPGILFVVAPAIVTYEVEGSVIWPEYSYGNADATITLGIYECQPRAFGPGGPPDFSLNGTNTWINTTPIASVHIGSGDEEQNNGPGSPYFLFGTTPVKPGFWYACVVMIQVNAYKSDTGFASAYTFASVPWFEYNLF